MFAVNVLGAVRVTTCLLPLLRRSQGRIVNVASIAGLPGSDILSHNERRLCTSLRLHPRDRKSVV